MGGRYDKSARTKVDRNQGHNPSLKILQSNDYKNHS